jgi:HSP20 family protein
MLMKYQPRNSMLNPFFDDLWRSSLNQSECDIIPRTDIIERKSDYIITAEMPGISKDNFKVEIENNVLTIHGKKFAQENSEGDQQFRSERQYGNYRRSFRLGDEIDSEKIDARYDSGILEIVLPKSKKAKPKMVEVKIN